MSRSRRWSARAPWGALVVVAVLAAGCAATGGSDDERYAPARPDVTQAGLQASGTVGGHQIAVSDGAPRLVVGDCDPADGPDEDVCFFTRELTGGEIVLVFENPVVLTPDADLEVGPGDCTTPAECDEVTDVAIVELRAFGEDRRRATGGRLQLGLVEDGRRYAGSFRLEFDDGRLSGTFDVVPRP